MTVSSQFQSVLTKLLSHRMSKICEKEGYYGDTQYGFRPGRSTSDCIFLLLAAVRKARKKRYKIAVAFCDLTKAYDSVNRDILYKKLSSLGFGGRVLSIIQSMYFNDCVQVKIGDRLSAPLWFSRGVKQGCCLSPLLFALYIAGLGVKLQLSKLGIPLGKEVLTGLFFADDLILISKTARRGMGQLLRMVDRFCKDTDMALSVSKTFMLTTGARNQSWKIGDSSDTLEESLVAKYLGINIQLRGRNTLQREKDMVKIGRRHAHAILSLTRVGLDRSKVAWILWETCAVPAMLYGVEAMTVGAGTVKEMEKIQGLIGSFILQVQPSTSKVAGWLDAGLMPIEYRIKLRKAMYYRKIGMNQSDSMITECLDEMSKEEEVDPWLKDIQYIEEELQANIIDLTKKKLKDKIINAAVQFVLDQKRQHKSVDCMPQPSTWFKIQPHVTDSTMSKILNRTRAGNMELGNRTKNRWGLQWKQCPWCLDKGVQQRLSEVHVILLCPAVKDERQRLGIKEMCYGKWRNGTMEPHISLRGFLGQDGALPVELLKRARLVHQLVEMWFSRVSTV